MDGQTFHWEMLSPEEVQKVLACGDAGQLSKLDPEYLCAYAAEDTDSTYLLLSEILEPALNKFPELREFHSTYGTALVEMICIQRLTGIQLNVEQLMKHESDLIKGLTAAQAELEADERVRAGVEAWHGVLLDNVNKQMPTDKFVPKKYPKEPARKFNKDGTLTTVYARWEANCRIVDYEPLRYNDKWTRWWELYLNVKEKVDDFWNMDLEGRKDKGLFNFFSNEHRRWFFYDFMQFPISVLTDKEQASTSGNALLGFGDLGKKFEKVDDLKKELQFVESLKNASDMETGIYHPRLKTPGTHTGRLSGDGGLNFQNLPKSRGFLEAFAPRKDRSLIDWDCTALEPTVLAEISRDPGLLSVYGPDAKKGRCIYLYVGTGLPGIKDVIINAGYNHESPVPMDTDRVKKEHKGLRGVCKVAHLSASYGAGAKKWYSTFKLQGLNYTLEQCQQFHVAYWKLFSKVKDHEAQLNVQWEKNGGWLLDALGLPFCVDAYARKDILNRKVQRSGHEILMIYQKLVADELTVANIPFVPWCYDLHDEVTIEVPTDKMEEANRIMGKVCFEKLNKILACGETSVILKGSGGPVATFANAKLED